MNVLFVVSRRYRVLAAVMCLKPICRDSLSTGLQVSTVFVKFNMKQLVRTASGTLNWLHGIICYHYFITHPYIFILYIFMANGLSVWLAVGPEFPAGQLAE